MKSNWEQKLDEKLAEIAVKEKELEELQTKSRKKRSKKEDK